MKHDDQNCILEITLSSVGDDVSTAVAGTGYSRATI